MYKLIRKLKSLIIIPYTLVAIIIIATVAVNVYVIIPMHHSLTAKPEVTEVFFACHLSNFHKMVISKFNEIHKGQIEVIPVDLSWKKFSTNERKDLLIRSLRSKSDRMDILEADYIWVHRFAKWCEPLDKYFDDNDVSKIVESAINTCIVNGKLLAMPLYLDMGIIYYRKDLIQKLPDSKQVETKLKESITWEEFIELSNRFDLTNSPYYIFPGDDYEGLVCSYMEMLLSQDNKVFDQGFINLESEESYKAAKLLVDLVNKYKLSPPDVAEFTELTSYRYFIENDGIFLRGWPVYDKDDENLYKETGKDTLLARAALPHFKGTNPASILGGWNLMVSKYSDKKEEVIKFLKFLISEQAQEILYNNAGYLPILKTFYENEHFLKKYPGLEYEKFILNRCINRPLMHDYTRISEIISFYLNKAIKGEIPVKEALKKATQMANSGEVVFK